MAASTNYIHEDDLLIVILKGKLDVETAPKVAREMEWELTDKKDLILDLKDLEYVSLAGLKVMLSWQKKLTQRSGTLTLINVNGKICELLDVTGLDSLFKIQK